MSEEKEIEKGKEKVTEEAKKVIRDLIEKLGPLAPNNIDVENLTEKEAYRLINELRKELYTKKDIEAIVNLLKTSENIFLFNDEGFCLFWDGGITLGTEQGMEDRISVWEFNVPEEKATRLLAEWLKKGPLRLYVVERTPPMEEGILWID